MNTEQASKNIFTYSKQVLKENKAPQIFQKINISYPSVMHTNKEIIIKFYFIFPLFYFC